VISRGDQRSALPVAFLDRPVARDQVFGYLAKLPPLVFKQTKENFVLTILIKNARQ